MYILVVNAGSSSVKYSLFSLHQNTEQVIAQGLIEKIGEKKSLFSSHEKAFLHMFKTIEKIFSLSHIDAVGHRIVHGGPNFYQPTLLTANVVKQLHTFDELAPLHNPFNLLGVALCKNKMRCPHYGVFDTGFHHTLPLKAKVYAIPYKYTQKDNIQRYGFHGISHHFVSLQAAKLLQKPITQLNIITCHLGNGASLCAIEKGASVETSMGFTPLEGLVMGTRCGDLDPDIVAYLMQKEKLSRKEIFHLLERESGLKGISGVNDMRDIISRMKKGNKRAKLAFDIFCHRIIKYLGAYIAVLNGTDCIVFTAGIGEHSAVVRHEILSHFAYLGIIIDAKQNAHNQLLISSSKSKIPVFVIPTNEALMIAQQVKEKIDKKR